MFNSIKTLKREYYIRKYNQNNILCYGNKSLLPNRVNVHYYHPEFQNGKDYAAFNLGDFLSSLVVDYMCKLNGLDIEKKINNTKNLYAVGSILLMGYHNATIWGTGLPYMPYFSKSFFHRSYFRNLDIRLLRGPRTREVLLNLGHDCPKLYGDPCVILPKIYTPHCKKEQDFVIVPHYSVESGYISKFGKNRVVSMNTQNYKDVIDSLSNSKCVVSSSLHGIILAESYGVPAVFFQDRSDALNFKYMDWYESTGRNNVVFAKSIDEALCNNDMIVPDLSKLQNNVINTFPRDLWMI